MAKLDAFFKLMTEQGASDLHLASGSPPLLRVNGDLQRVRYPALSNDDLKTMLYEVTPATLVKQFEETGDADFAHAAPGLSRYRVNLFLQQHGVAAVFRQIPTTIPSLEALGLPRILLKLPLLPQGLVLVTGPTGSGKSTTLAALIDYANTHRRDHILTIEDPVEFVHANKNCVVNQREVGSHTRTFAAALRAVLREDPDIMVGEMRDLETIRFAIEAASTGHLVFATLHTRSAAAAISRMVDLFPAAQQSLIRATLADSLQAIVAQVLLKRRDAAGRCVALEILLATPAVRALIRDGKTHQIPTVLQTGRAHGMQALDDALLEHVQSGRIRAAEAYPHATDKTRFRVFLDNADNPADTTLILGE
jgi:twitching motility protein PilT